jgi:hypothetical protein
MLTEYSATLFDFAPVEARAVVAAFDGGAITSDAGALLTGRDDRTIHPVDRLAACFPDHRCPGLIEHEVSTSVGQRVFSPAPGYEDLNDDDHLHMTRHADPGRPVAGTPCRLRTGGGQVDAEPAGAQPFAAGQAS